MNAIHFKHTWIGSWSFGDTSFLVLYHPIHLTGGLIADHSEQTEGNLIADVHAHVRLGHNIFRGSFLRELTEANARQKKADSALKISSRRRNVLFDGNHTLNFIFM